MRLRNHLHLHTLQASPADPRLLHACFASACLWGGPLRCCRPAALCSLCCSAMHWSELVCRSALFFPCRVWSCQCTLQDMGECIQIYLTGVSVCAGSGRRGEGQPGAGPATGGPLALQLRGDAGLLDRRHRHLRRALPPGPMRHQHTAVQRRRLRNRRASSHSLQLPSLQRSVVDRAGWVGARACTPCPTCIKRPLWMFARLRYIKCVCYMECFPFHLRVESVVGACGTHAALTDS